VGHHRKRLPPGTSITQFYQGGAGLNRRAAFDVKKTRPRQSRFYRSPKDSEACATAAEFSIRSGLVKEEAKHFLRVAHICSEIPRRAIRSITGQSFKEIYRLQK